MPSASRRLAFICAVLALSVGAVFFAVRRRSVPHGVTVDSVKNIAYPAGPGASAEWVRLQDGVWDETPAWGARWRAIREWMADERTSPWEYDGLRDHLEVDSVVLGTFAGRPAAAVAFLRSCGGTPEFMGVGLVVERQGEPACVAAAPIGDDMEVESMQCGPDHLVLDLASADPGEAISRRERRTYGWSGKGELDLLAITPLPAATE